MERTKIFPPARIKVQPSLAYTNCYTLLQNGVFTYVKKCFAASLEIGQCSSAGTTQELFTRFMGRFFLEGAKTSKQIILNWAEFSLFNFQIA